MPRNCGAFWSIKSFSQKPWPQSSPPPWRLRMLLPTDPTCRRGSGPPRPPSPGKAAPGLPAGAGEPRPPGSREGTLTISHKSHRTPCRLWRRCACAAVWTRPSRPRRRRRGARSAGPPGGPPRARGWPRGAGGPGPPWRRGARRAQAGLPLPRAKGSAGRRVSRRVSPDSRRHGRQPRASGGAGTRLLARPSCGPSAGTSTLRAAGPAPGEGRPRAQASPTPTPRSSALPARASRRARERPRNPVLPTRPPPGGAALTLAARAVRLPSHSGATPKPGATFAFYLFCSWIPVRAG